MIGRTLGHYHIVEKIGAGGMGEVYRARDERLDRDVAVKVLPAGTLADEAARKRFRKEALALAKLNHPHIGTIHDFDTQGGVDFLVMEYVPGSSLADKVAGGALPEKEVAALGAQVASALDEAHGQRIIHRDLKPGNIIVTPRGQAKVLDFGLAKLARPAADADLTQSATEAHAVAGTMPYMAPEQLRGESVDARADIWALGCVLYEMATGQRPFREGLVPRLTDAILHQSPQPPSELNRRISAELERIILKCLDKETERRYQSAKELHVDLERLLTPGMAASVVVARAPANRWLGWSFAVVFFVLALAFGLDVGGVRTRLTGRSSAPRIQSLAVLPLENLSRDPEQEYFADGMTEALITELSKLSALDKVISRTSVMRYKKTDKSMPQIARELGVDGLVEGSVAREGDQVRILVQLIHGPGDKHLWAESYQREVRGILALQAEVARAIAAEIRITLTPEEQARLARPRNVDPEAHDAYLKGRYQWNMRPRGLTEAIRYFEMAIAKDPNYALPYSGLADSYGALGTWEGGTVSPQETLPKAKAAASRALQIDERLAEAHASLAYVKLHFDWDWPGTEQQLKRAIELDPRYATAHHWYSHYLMTAGRIPDSLAESRRAAELDPLDPIVAAVHLPWHFYYAHQFDESVAACRKLLAMDPDSFWGHFELGRAYEQKGMFEAAVAELNKAVAIKRDMTFALGALGHAYGASRQRDQAFTVLAQLKNLARKRYVSAADVAVIYVGLREKDQAMAWLQKAYAERSWYMVLLAVDPRLAPLRSDPHFQDLIRRMNFPQ